MQINCTVIRFTTCTRVTKTLVNGGKVQLTPDSLDARTYDSETLSWLEQENNSTVMRCATFSKMQFRDISLIKWQHKAKCKGGKCIDGKCPCATGKHFKVLLTNSTKDLLQDAGTALSDSKQTNIKESIAGSC